MASDDDGPLRDSDSWRFADDLSGFPDASIEENLGLEARTMQNNNEARTLTNATADVTQRMLAHRVHDGKSVNMSVATDIIRGVIAGYSGITSMTRVEVVFKLAEVVDGLIVDEVSRVRHAPKGSKLTWQALADLVGWRRSTLHGRYRNRVYHPKA